ncbi:hypothetical protein ACIA78_39745 [Streptomyces xanthochromogenes]|uniref:hypothetical protein n=1 Tax=Streptomyces xanthochromogenes TaxID=67384 RepID=UPI00342C225D
MTGRRLAAATAAMAALLLAGGMGGTAAQAAPARAKVQAADDFTCGYGALCVHLLHSDGSYTWESLYYCQNWKLNGSVTWYTNNQTSGTVATFYYPWAANSKAAYYSGRPPVWPYDASHHAPSSVTNC